MFSYFLIKLPRFQNLSVGDIFTDKPKNREKLLIKPLIHWWDYRLRRPVWKFQIESRKLPKFSMLIKATSWEQDFFDLKLIDPYASLWCARFLSNWLGFWSIPLSRSSSFLLTYNIFWSISSWVFKIENIGFSKNLSSREWKTSKGRLLTQNFQHNFTFMTSVQD